MQTFNTDKISEADIALNKNFSLSKAEDVHALVDELPKLFRTASSKRKSKELGFVTLCSDGKNVCWFKLMRKFQHALYEAFATVQLIAAQTDVLSAHESQVVKMIYAQMSKLVK